MAIKKKKLIQVRFLSRLDALVELRNRLLIEKTNRELLKTISEEEFMDLRYKNQLTEYQQEKLERDIASQKEGADAFDRSLAVIDDMIQKEINKDQPKEEKRIES